MDSEENVMNVVDPLPSPAPEKDAGQFVSAQTLEETPGSSKALLKTVTVSDMPEEILEHIIAFLSPYREMDAAKQVSKQWNRVVKCKFTTPVIDLIIMSNLTSSSV